MLCSVVSDSATLWTVAFKALLSMGFPRQEYWSGVGMEPMSLVSPALQADSLPLSYQGSPSNWPGKKLKTQMTRKIEFRSLDQNQDKS